MKLNIKQTNFKLPTPIENQNTLRTDARKLTTTETYPERRSKRYFTSRQEEDKQENSSACPSIEKELPELSIYLAEKHAAHQNTEVIQELLKENKLKEQALRKATDMIELLREENNDLNERLDELEGVLREKERLIEVLQEEKLNFSQQRIFPRDILSQKIRDGDRTSKNTLYTPRDGVPSKSDLFFQFAHSQRQVGTHRSQDKIINNDHPTFKDLHPQITISKKLTPYASRHTVKPQPTTGSLQSSAITKIAMLTISEQLEKNQLMVQQLDYLTHLQEEELEVLMEEVKAREGEWTSEMEEEQEEVLTMLGQNVSKNLFGSGDDLRSNDRLNQPARELLASYEAVIERYRDYSAYLKSYLCEAINALNFIASKPTNANYESNMVPLLKSISKQIATRYRYKLGCVQRENCQLKGIVEGLIRNIEMTRKGEPSVRHWSEYHLEQSK